MCNSITPLEASTGQEMPLSAWPATSKLNCIFTSSYLLPSCHREPNFHTFFPKLAPLLPLLLVIQGLRQLDTPSRGSHKCCVHFYVCSAFQSALLPTCLLHPADCRTRAVTPLFFISLPHKRHVLRCFRSLNLHG